ncbi:MAG TPA: hypothetical protein VGD71_30775 [Kribbella sp.]|jgi:hypothetical protein
MLKFVAGMQRAIQDPRSETACLATANSSSGLDEWLARFEQHGVRHSPIAEREYGAVLAFKDADGIQFEMFFKADHP